MARSTTVAYRLPCAVLVVTGTLRRTLDEDDPAHKDGFAGVAPTLVSKTVTLRHQADETALRTVVVKGGLFFQYKASFSNEEDGRLSKAAAEATGAGAELISAGATLAGAALGALTVFAADTDLEDRRKSNYKLAHADVMEESQALSARRTQVRACIRTLEESLVSDPASAHSLHPQLEALGAVADGIDSRLTTLGAHYAAWLATRRKTVDETFEVEAPLAELPQTLEAAELRYGGPASSITDRLEGPLDLKAMWLRFGLGVLATWERRPAAAAPWKPGRTLPAQCLVVREAEPLRLVVVEHEYGRPAVTGRSRHLVADATSPHHELELRRSLFGRRSLTVSFSDNGYLAGIDVEGAASVGEAAKALSGVPGVSSRVSTRSTS